MEILHICNLWILLRKIVIYLVDFFAVKVDGSDVYPGICLYENLFTDSWVDVTSVKFNSKKVYEVNIFGRQDTLQFLSGEFKYYKYVKPFH